MKARDTKEKHVCLQCLELSLQGKHEERFTSVCRLDSSSIQRHKERWHKLLERKTCTFVPISSPAASRIRDKYKTYGRCDSKNQQSKSLTARQGQESKDPQGESAPTDASNQPAQQYLVSEIPPRQTTLLDLKASDNSGFNEGASSKQCLDAISALSLKVDNISNQTATLKHLACENTETRDSIIALTGTENIIQMNDACDTSP